MKHKRRGRPPFPPGKARGRLVTFRATNAELAMLKARAKKAGLTLTAWLRRAGGLPNE